MRWDAMGLHFQTSNHFPPYDEAFYGYCQHFDRGVLQVVLNEKAVPGCIYTWCSRHKDVLAVVSTNAFVAMLNSLMDPCGVVSHPLGLI